MKEVRQRLSTPPSKTTLKFNVLLVEDKRKSGRERGRTEGKKKKLIKGENLKYRVQTRIKE